MKSIYAVGFALALSSPSILWAGVSSAERDEISSKMKDKVILESAELSTIDRKISFIDRLTIEDQATLSVQEARKAYDLERSGAFKKVMLSQALVNELEGRRTLSKEELETLLSSTKKDLQAAIEEAAAQQGEPRAVTVGQMRRKIRQEAGANADIESRQFFGVNNPSSLPANQVLYMSNSGAPTSPKVQELQLVVKAIEVILEDRAREAAAVKVTGGSRYGRLIMLPE